MTDLVDVLYIQSDLWQSASLIGLNGVSDEAYNLLAMTYSNARDMKVSISTELFEAELRHPMDTVERLLNETAPDGDRH